MNFGHNAQSVQPCIYLKNGSLRPVMDSATRRTRFENEWHGRDGSGRVVIEVSAFCLTTAARAFSQAASKRLGSKIASAQARFSEEMASRSLAAAHSILRTRLEMRARRR